MKTTILTLCILFSLAASAQDNKHVTIHAGEVPIEQQMTAEQKKQVTHLNITGKLLDEDYAFLRTTLHAQLRELNLRDADIDTIPAHALESSFSSFVWLILPRKLVHLGDSCLLSSCFSGIEITGHFPSRGTSVVDPYLTRFEVSIENPYCITKYVYDKYGPGYTTVIYSADGDTLFTTSFMEDEIIADGTKVIAGHAFENFQFEEDGINFLIPASVDSIGDMAFHNIAVSCGTWGWRPGVSYTKNTCTNLSLEPQKLGKDVFDFRDDHPERYPSHLDPFDEGFGMYVPEEALETYRQTDVWNKFNRLRAITSSSPYYDRVVPVSSPSNDEIKCSFDKSGNCDITSHKEIKAIQVFSTTGALLGKHAVHGKTYTLNLKKGTGTPHLLNIVFEDGTSQIIKSTNNL